MSVCPKSICGVVLFSLLAFAACRAAEEPASVAAAPDPEFPRWKFDPSMVYPADGSLARPEDGVALSDGRLLVADQAHGLRRVEPDGSSVPFGEMPVAGYLHDPPAHAGGANGVSFEPGGGHVLVADVFHGGIYRVDIETGATERIFQHRYGVNAAVRDSTGAVWFTQSALNTPEEGEARMWAAVNNSASEGALLRVGVKDGRLAADAEVLIDSLQFANGLAIDEEAGLLYLAEIVAGRVHRYRVDVASGRLSGGEVIAEGLWADNVELDEDGNLWIAVPLGNEIVVMTRSGERHTVFREQTPAQAERIAEIARRAENREPVLELFGPELREPLPGLVTGMILSPGKGPVYLTGLGNALVRLAR